LELSQAKATIQLLASSLPFDEPSRHDVVARVSKFLAVNHKESKLGREDLIVEVDQIEQKASIGTNPLRFTYNMDSGDDLRISVLAIVDPVSESAQRVAPLLRAMRDNLKLPLTLVLAPRTLMDAGDKISSYYRFVAEPSNLPDVTSPHAIFSNLPTNHILTLRLDIPESWNIQQTFTIQDTDNLRCDLEAGCSDDAHAGSVDESISAHERHYVTRVEYELKNLLFFGQCYDAVKQSPPNGLMLTLTKKESESISSTAEVQADGSITMPSLHVSPAYSDTLVMKNVGYWQLRGSPGVWNLNIAPSSRGAEIFDIVEGKLSRSSGITVTGISTNNATKTIVMKDFLGKGELLIVKRRKGYEKATLFYDEEVINVFSLATGHLYERFLKIMMLSVTKRTSSKVKFWLFENFLSPTFKASAKHMALEIGCEVEFVTYKWPEWLRGQSEKQRIIWGYKILFLDVLFPLDVKKIIYVDADQVVRGDLKELWDMDLQGAPYGYTPMCSSRETTLGFQFWRGGFWESHLRGKPYHISALYVVDLEKFRKDLVGDVLRSVYQQLSADPNSLSNLDQDLPNYAQHQVPIFSLPQEWLWCESWCSDESKETAKTIDLCNNPLHKEPKVSMAKRIVSGDLFQESWIDLDAEVEKYEKDYLTRIARSL
jgi:UDP-glucose:glycoprotein glucosyltransferase